MKVWRGTSGDPGQTVAAGAVIGSLAQPGDVIALVGELGAGKTQLVRGLAQGMGLDPTQVASPTFVLMHEYEQGGRILVHVDAYRLRGPEELSGLGWEEGCGELFEGAVAAVEWADKVSDRLGEALRIELSHTGQSSRTIELTCSPSWRERWERLCQGLETVLSATSDEVSPPQPTQPCPICGKPTAVDEPTFPFCGGRCRMIDLGKWLGGDYRVSRPIEADDEGP